MIFRIALYTLLLASGPSLAFGQPQTVTKPVLTATPPPSSQAPVTQATPGLSNTTIQTVQGVQTGSQTHVGEAGAEPPDAQVPDQVPISSAASATAPDPATSSSTYIIGPQDSLQVSVWKEPAISGTFPVRPDGMISLALIGEVDAAGKTPRKLGDEVALRLKKYITDPSVNVVVLAVYPKQVYLLGEVAHIGALAITPEMTPLQAIAAAGGVTPFAKTKQIYILRGLPGKQQKIFFNYKKAIKDGNQQGVSLVPGDTIIVP